LLGEAGKAFCEAIEQKLIGAINKLHAKFQELQSDLQAAEDYMRAADATSKAQFN
jgi:hypothetical protein